MQSYHFLSHSLQEDLPIFTSSHLKQIFIYSKVKDMFIQNSLIKAAPSKAFLCKCPVFMVYFHLELCSSRTNGAGSF